MARNTRGSNPEYSWRGNSFIFQGQTGATGISSIFSAGESITIRRVRGTWLTMLDVGAGGDAGSIGMGLMVASDTQVTAGATAFPSPADFFEADWLWHSFSMLRSETGTQSDDMSSHIDRGVIDSKAMRKMRLNDQLVFVFEMNILGGTPTLDIMAGVRCLVSGG